MDIRGFLIKEYKISEVISLAEPLYDIVTIGITNNDIMKTAKKLNF